MFRVTGIWESRITALNLSLSIASAEPRTPAPTYGTSASSSKPCTVPSSPKGPCRTGITTSTFARVAGTLSVGTGSVSTAVRPSPSSNSPAAPGSSARAAPWLLADDDSLLAGVGHRLFDRLHLESRARQDRLRGRLVLVGDVRNGRRRGRAA